MRNNYKSYRAEVGRGRGGINNHVHLNQRLPLSSDISSHSRPAIFIGLGSKSEWKHTVFIGGRQRQKNLFLDTSERRAELIKMWDTSLNIFSTVSKQASQRPGVKEGMGGGGRFWVGETERKMSWRAANAALFQHADLTRQAEAANCF